MAARKRLARISKSKDGHIERPWAELADWHINADGQPDGRSEQHADNKTDGCHESAVAEANDGTHRHADGSADLHADGNPDGCSDRQTDDAASDEGGSRFFRSMPTNGGRRGQGWI